MTEFQHQLQAIAALQRHLLPRALPRLSGWDVAVAYSTSPWPGGDYYDFLPLPDGRVVCLVADASGHGGPAAVIMAMTRVVLHSCPQSSGSQRGPFCPLLGLVIPPPRVLLQHLNQIIVENTLEGQFMTMFCGVLDPAGATLRFANAGHPPPRCWRAAERKVVGLPDIGGFPLGIQEDTEYLEEAVAVGPGDVLLCYTDGVTEAHNRKGETFGCRRLDACLRRAAAHGAEAVKDAVLKALDNFLDGEVPHDDQTVLVLRRPAPDPDRET